MTAPHDPRIDWCRRTLRRYAEFNDEVLAVRREEETNRAKYAEYFNRPVRTEKKDEAA